MYERLTTWLERLERDRRRQVLMLLARRPMSEAELGRHFRLPLTLGWHLRELHALGLLAYNRRVGRYHLVWPALTELAGFCSELAGLPDPLSASATLPHPSGPAGSA